MTAQGWAVSDAEAGVLAGSTGWIADYFDMMCVCTDAPEIYHIGVAHTILSAALAACDIDIRRVDGKSYLLGTPLWSVVVGRSGDRKSRAMGVGIRLLQRARSVTAHPVCLLPTDGSIEAWHDMMAGDPHGTPPVSPVNNVMLYRDELAYLFDQSHRGYSEGLKHWLMTLHTGDPVSRLTKASGTPVIIERPRLAILGGIPPDTFSAKSNQGDWRSGFLARMVYWAGVREKYHAMPAQDPAREMALAKWLSEVPMRMSGRIVIPSAEAKRISDWIYDNVEKAYKTVSDEVMSHLIRFQDLAFRLAAFYEVSQLTKAPAGVLFVTDASVTAALAVLTVLLNSSPNLFVELSKTKDRAVEDEVLGFLAADSTRAFTAPEILTCLHGLSLSSLYRILKDLESAGHIYRCGKVALPGTPGGKAQGKGRPGIGYRLKT